MYIAFQQVASDAASNLKYTTSDCGLIFTVNSIGRCRSLIKRRHSDATVTEGGGVSKEENDITQKMKGRKNNNNNLIFQKRTIPGTALNRLHLSFVVVAIVWSSMENNKMWEDIVTTHKDHADYLAPVSRIQFPGCLDQRRQSGVFVLGNVVLALTL